MERKETCEPIFFKKIYFRERSEKDYFRVGTTFDCLVLKFEKPFLSMTSRKVLKKYLKPHNFFFSSKFNFFLRKNQKNKKGFDVTHFS